MQRFRGRSKLVVLASLVVGLGVPLALWLLAPWQPDWWLADRIMVQMRQAPAGQIDGYAAQLAALDSPGWERLLAAVQDRDRPELRIAAQRALVDSVQSWRRLSGEDSERKVADMSKLLAQRASTRDVAAICFYADMAERLLDWPNYSLVATDRVYNCEQVVRAARKVGWPLRPADDPPVQPLNATVQPPSLPADGGREVTHLSDLSEPETPMPTDSSAATTAKISDTPSSETVADATPSDQSPAPGDVASRVANKLEAPQPTPVEIQATPLATSESSNPLRRNWEQMELMEIVRTLRDRQLATEAEAELRRRKLNAVSLRVARAAADPSAENRLKLVHMIPELVGVDSIGWLMLLAKDESPRVRFAAVQLLSTTNDPRVLQRLQELDETETDDQIRTVLRKAQTVMR